MGKLTELMGERLAALVELGLSLTTIRSPSIFISQGFINGRRIYAHVH